MIAGAESYKGCMPAPPAAHAGPDAGMPPFRAWLSKFWSGTVVWNTPMIRYSTFKVGGPAAALVFPRQLSSLGRLIKGLREKGIPWRVIGRGSNILVPDEGFPGVIIVLGPDFAAIEAEPCGQGGVIVRVEAGCSLARLLQWCVEHEWGGLEFAAGIPGSVGGGIVMNAGAWGRDMGEIVHSIVLLDEGGKLHDLGRKELRFVYRGLRIRRDHGGTGMNDYGAVGNHVLVSGSFMFNRRKRKDIEADCRKAGRRRREIQPRGMASAGSFFKNPDGFSAGQLIEQAGLKGFRVGGAMVSERHANFIVNTGNARARDIYELMEFVQQRVRDRFGISLEPEVHIIRCC